MDERDPHALTVMTLNLWNTNCWAERREAVVAWINRVEPDLLALQEVVRTPVECQATWLAERTKMAARFAVASHHEGYEFGNAVLSRLPIVGTRSRQLTATGAEGERRGILTVETSSRRGTVSISSTHLAYRFDDGWVREAQVVELAEFLQAPAGGYPSILCGDLNARPDSAEVRFLKGLTTLGGRSFHLFDAFEVARPGVAGSTWDNRNPYAVTSHSPDQRIDYILVGVPTRDGAGRILAADVVCDEPVAGVWASDHFGVAARLSCADCP